MYAGTSCDDNFHVAGPVGNTDILGIAGFGEPARAPMPQALDRAFDETGEGNAGALVHRLLDILLADTVARQRRRMLGTENEKRPGREDDVIVSQTRHGPNDVLQN